LDHNTSIATAGGSHGTTSSDAEEARAYAEMENPEHDL
jgi:hypothetical protein